MLLAVLLVLSAFFSGSETGLVALNRYRLRHQAKAGQRGARLAQRLLAKPDRMFGLILLGNNLVNILAASIATVIGLRLLGDAGIWVATLALTAVILIFAEVAPKTIAALYPERFAYPASFVLTPLMKLLYPAVWIVNMFASALLRPFGSANSRPTMITCPGRNCARCSRKAGARSRSIISRCCSTSSTSNTAPWMM